MIEAGEVLEIKGGKAKIIFNRSSMCKNCGACGISSKSNSIIISLENTLNAKTGDTVVVEFSSKNALLSSFIAYGIPLLMLFLGIFIGYVLPFNPFVSRDIFAAVTGLVMCCFGFLILKFLNPYFKKKFNNIYLMVAIK